jgi:hypothetical protein
MNLGSVCYRFAYVVVSSWWSAACKLMQSLRTANLQMCTFFQTPAGKRGRCI